MEKDKKQYIAPAKSEKWVAKRDARGFFKDVEELRRYLLKNKPDRFDERDERRH